MPSKMKHSEAVSRVETDPKPEPSSRTQDKPFFLKDSANDTGTPHEHKTAIINY